MKPITSLHLQEDGVCRWWRQRALLSPSRRESWRGRAAEGRQAGEKAERERGGGNGSSSSRHGGEGGAAQVRCVQAAAGGSKG